MTMSQPHPTQPLPPQTQPQPQPKKKHGPLFWILLIIGALVALVLFGSCVAALSSGGSTTEGAPATTAPADKPASDKPNESAAPKAEAKIGEPVKDGELRFVVNSVKCGATRVGDQYLGAKAQGQFCMVNMKVKNISDGPTTFDGDNQTLINQKGQQFSADTEAMLYINDENQTFLEEINPGNQVKGTLVFDIPKKSKPDKLLLKAGVLGFSEGVIVNVS
jgi:hypothetical protein